MNNVWLDLKFALRQLRRSPSLAATAILTLALGIGANTAIFSLLDQALLRSLPVRDPQQLVVLEGTGDAWSGSTHTQGGDASNYFSYPMYKDLRDRNAAFSGLIATQPADIAVAHDGASDNARAELVSGNYFNVLGVRPALGRLLTPADDAAPGASPVAVLSFEFWKNQFGADPSIVGKTISVNAHPFEVVGVAAPNFRSAVWGESPGVFMPITMMDSAIPGTGKLLERHNDRGINVIGRLKPGETREQAEVALAPLWHALRADEVKVMGIRSPRFLDEFVTKSRLLVHPGARGFSYQRANFEKPLLAVMAMALLVLLIAVVNVASLLLVRSAGRAREFALRYALGAGGIRIAQQLLLEGLLIGIAGGAAGMALAPIAIGTLVKQLAGDQPYVAFTTAIDPRVLFFNFAIALAAAVLFSLAPLAQLRRPDLASALGQKSSTNSGAALNLRRSVVCLQVGLSVLLLVAAGLFVRTMQNLRHVNMGFNTAHLVTFGINPKLAGYAPDAIPALQQRVIGAMGALPGVQGVAVTSDPELGGNKTGGNVSVAGYTAPPDDSYDVEVPFVSPGYFATLGIPMVAGRSFSDGDTLDHPKVGIVNESFAKHFCGSASACLGRMMADGGGNGVKLDTEIVGVVRDNKHSGIRDAAVPTWFRPLRQRTDPDGLYPGELYVYLRTGREPAEELATVRRTMHELDPALTLSGLRTMEAQIDDDLSNERMVSLLAIAFGVLATVLAGVGLYGVLAYTTAQRTREIGIRIALGSSRLAVSRLVLKDVLLLAGLGIAVALPVAFGLSRLVKSQLYGVSAADPLTIAGAVVLIALVALAAALIPASRAASVNPTEALRTE